MAESWTDWFIYQVKSELREKITDFEEVWNLMFLPPDKQAFLDVAARIASLSIGARDFEIVRLEELVQDQTHRIAILERDLEHEQNHNFMAPTVISRLTQTTIDQHKHIQELLAEIEELKGDKLKTE